VEQERDWGGLPLQEVNQDNMLELKDMKAAWLWMLPPAAMEVAIELLWEDKLAHPLWPHVFVVPHFMTQGTWGRMRTYFSLYQWASCFGGRRSSNLQ